MTADVSLLIRDIKVPAVERIGVGVGDFGFCQQWQRYLRCWEVAIPQMQTHLQLYPAGKNPLGNCRAPPVNVAPVNVGHWSNERNGRKGPSKGGEKMLSASRSSKKTMVVRRRGGSARTVASHASRNEAAAGDTAGGGCWDSGDCARKGRDDGDQGGGWSQHGVHF